MSIVKNQSYVDKKFFLLVFGIMFTIFLFTSNGHRYSPDEDYAEDQAYRIMTMHPDPMFVQGQSKPLFQYPTVYPPETMHGPVCNNGILCYPSNIGHSLTEIPFIFVNDKLNVFTKENTALSLSDFDDASYLYWRNSLKPDFTFLQFFYGPVFCALTTAVFFLITRTFGFSIKNSIVLTFIFGLSTMVWAYSHTSLNAVPATFFDLLGFFFFRKFQKNKSSMALLLSSSCFGFGFLVRPDAIFFIIPIFLLFLYELRKENAKIKKITSYVVPLLISYIIFQVIIFVRFGNSIQSAITGPAQGLGLGPYPIYAGIFGLLLSPGVGLLIFAPIFFTIFFSFTDFYKKNKPESLLFLSFASLFLIYYGSGYGGSWHGLVAWGPRYLYPLVPFLLLPLGASIEKRKSRIFKIMLVVLASLGFFFNLVYVIQDVPFFVWCLPGCTHGLFSLGTVMHDLYIHPAVLWTFEYSQLTQSIITAFTHLQPDMLLLRMLGTTPFVISFILVIIPLVYLLVRSLHRNMITNKENKI